MMKPVVTKNKTASRRTKIVVLAALLCSVHVPTHGMMRKWQDIVVMNLVVNPLKTCANRFLVSDTFRHIKYAGLGMIVGGTTGVLRNVGQKRSFWGVLFDIISHSFAGGFLGWTSSSYRMRLKAINKDLKDANENLERAENRFFNNQTKIINIDGHLKAQTEIREKTHEGLSDINENFKNVARKDDVNGTVVILNQLTSALVNKNFTQVCEVQGNLKALVLSNDYSEDGDI